MVLRIRGRHFRASQTFMAIDVGRMQSDFAGRVDWLIGAVKDTAPASGFDEVLVANEPELRTERKRLMNGIPIPGGTWEALLKGAVRVGIHDAPQILDVQ